MKDWQSGSSLQTIKDQSSVYLRVVASPESIGIVFQISLREPPRGRRSMVSHRKRIDANSLTIVPENSSRLQRSTIIRYQNLRVGVPERFTQYSDVLLRNQRIAIDQGLVHNVNKPARVYIVGWMNGSPAKACVHVVFPRSTLSDVENLPCIPMCWVGKDNLVVAALVLVSISTCWLLPDKGSARLDLLSLEDSYRKILAE